LKEPFFSRTGFTLWFIATLSAICVLPYANALSPNSIAKAATQLGLPEAAIWAVSIVQSAIVLGLATFIGLWAARKLDLKIPVLDAVLRAKPPDSGLRRAVVTAVSLGIASGVILIGLDRLLFMPLAPDALVQSLQTPPPRWMGFLASFYGGIGEEIQLRLFLLSVSALIIRTISNFLFKPRRTNLSASVFWSANILAALVFGLGHLPATAAIMPLIPIVIVRAIILNGLVGIVAGYLFWKRGLEMAMLYHFSADIVLHVIIPL